MGRINEEGEFNIMHPSKISHNDRLVGSLYIQTVHFQHHHFRFDRYLVYLLKRSRGTMMNNTPVDLVNSLFTRVSLCVYFSSKIYTPCLSSQWQVIAWYSGLDTQNR